MECYGVDVPNNKYIDIARDLRGSIGHRAMNESPVDALTVFSKHHAKRLGDAAELENQAAEFIEHRCCGIDLVLDPPTIAGTKSESEPGKVLELTTSGCRRKAHPPSEVTHVVTTRTASEECTQDAGASLGPKEAPKHGPLCSHGSPSSTYTHCVL